MDWFLYDRNLRHERVKGVKWIIYFAFQDSDVFSQMYLAIRNGHYKLAGEYMKKAVKTDAFGYNFLHMEVLCNTTEPLTKFKSTSVTKKPYGDQYVRSIL